MPQLITYQHEVTETQELACLIVMTAASKQCLCVLFALSSFK